MDKIWVFAKFFCDFLGFYKFSLNKKCRALYKMLKKCHLHFASSKNEGVMAKNCKKIGQTFGSFSTQILAVFFAITSSYFELARCNWHFFSILHDAQHFLFNEIFQKPEKSRKFFAKTRILSMQDFKNH